MTPESPRTGIRRFLFCWSHIPHVTYRYWHDEKDASPLLAFAYVVLITALFPALYASDDETRETVEQTILDTLDSHD